MNGSNDFDRLVQEAESSLVERRKALKAELDQAWEMDVARSSEILNRMLGLTARLQLLAETRDRFQALSRARRSVAEGLTKARGLLEAVLADCVSLGTERESVTGADLDRVRELLSEELGRDLSAVELPAAPADEVEALLRMLDRCGNRLEATAGARPVDLGERGIELRPAEPEEVELVEPTGSGGVEELARAPVRSSAELEIAGLEQELEGEDGILLADEVVDTESPKPAPRPSPPVEPARPAPEEPAAASEEEVVFVEERD